MKTWDIETKSDCLLYPTNVVSCSWSLDHLQATQVVPHVRYFLMTLHIKATALVSISWRGCTVIYSIVFCLCSTSICDSEILLQSWNHSTAERVGSASITLQEFDDLEVALQFTITLLGNKTVYTKIYDKHNLGKRGFCISE